MKDKTLILLFVFSLFLWCCALAYPVQTDYDLWMRLIVGKSVVENGIILKQDIFSYTPTHVWLDHEWLSSVFFYFISKFGNFIDKPLIQIFLAAKIAFTFLILILMVLCVKIRNNNILNPYRIIYFCFSALAMNVVFASTVRCHMFSFLFFTVYILILEYYRKTGKKILLVLLPLIMLIWANAHGGCLAGLGLIFIYSAGEFLNRKKYLPVLFALIVSLSVLFINPYGVSYVKFLFFAGTMNRELISEWSSPFFMFNQTYKFILYFIFMCFIALLNLTTGNIKFRNVDKTKLLILTVTAFVGCLHAKLLPFFVISSSVFMFNDVFHYIDKITFLKNLSNNKIVYALIVLFSCITIKFGEINKYSAVSNIKYPVKAVEFIKENNITGNIITDMTYGSYCIYKLFPQNKIFMDGRYEEVYDNDLLITLKNFMNVEGDNPNSAIDDYKTDIVLLPILKNHKTLKVFESLMALGWKEIYNDTNWVIFVSPRYEGSYKDLNFDIKTAYKTLFDSTITKEVLKVN